MKAHNTLPHLSALAGIGTLCLLWTGLASSPSPQEAKPVPAVSQPKKLIEEAATAPQTPEAEPEQITETFTPTASYQEFALAAYRKLAQGLDGNPAAENLLFSPVSIGVVLDSLRLGARHTTATELEQVLGLPAGPVVPAADSSAEREAPTEETSNETASPVIDSTLSYCQPSPVSKALKAFGGSGEMILRLANALWVSPRAKLNPDYAPQLKAVFGTTASPLDFTQTVPAAATINRWTQEHTENMIAKIVEPGDFNGNTRLAITNATYFKADWERAFPIDKTMGAPFTLGDGSTITVPLMSTSGQFRHATLEDGTQVLELPYTQGQASLMVVLPKDTGALATLEQALTPQWLKQTLGQLKTKTVHVSLPRFEIDAPTPAKTLLQALGVETLFSESEANLSGISQSEPLYITAFKHQAKLRVDEQGSEGAAATAAIAGVRSFRPEPTAFRADRPFLFALREHTSNQLLFLGRLTRPEAMTDPPSDQDAATTKHRP